MKKKSLYHLTEKQWMTLLKKKRVRIRTMPIRACSIGRSKRLVEYEKLKKEHFKNYPRCFRCKNAAKKPTLHHPFGRIGSLLTEYRLFQTLCLECHNWVHKNPVEARKEKLLAPLGQFNSNPYKSKP